MKKTVVLNVVGLSSGILDGRMPLLGRFARAGAVRTIAPVFPALTCPSQSTYLTGLLPSGHGIVGNGWYFHDLAQICFWRQANALVRGEKAWEAGRSRDPRFTCANLFWWFNMYSSVDCAVTPRPVYRADGLKIPDLHTTPPELRDALQNALGPFPLVRFWGPGADIVSSRWIGEAALMVFDRFAPTLTLVYLPHLDYVLQREGPNGTGAAAELGAIDRLCGGLIDRFRARGVRVVVLSEYGIVPVAGAVRINRILRERGFLAVREECGEDHLDAGASRAFAVADHQIAHVYVNDKTRLAAVRNVLERADGISEVLDREAQTRRGIGHERSGDLVAAARSDRWFSYPYWLDQRRAPDFARTVDIHRKPGYDPAELFLDPAIRFPKLRIAGRLAARRLGFRPLLDVVPLDETLVRGSHGRDDAPEPYRPVLLAERADLLPPGDGAIAGTEIKELILRHVFE